MEDLKLRSIDYSWRVGLLRRLYLDGASNVASLLNVSTRDIKVSNGLWLIFFYSTLIRLIIDRSSEEISKINWLTKLTIYEDCYQAVRTIDDQHSYEIIFHSRQNKQFEMRQIYIENELYYILRHALSFLKIEGVKNSHQFNELIRIFSSCFPPTLTIKGYYNSLSLSVWTHNLTYYCGTKESVNFWRLKNKDFRIKQHGLQSFGLMYYHPHDLYSESLEVISWFNPSVFGRRCDIRTGKRSFPWKPTIKAIVFRAQSLFSFCPKTVVLVDYNIMEGQYPWPIKNEIIKNRNILCELAENLIKKGYNVLFKARDKMISFFQERLDKLGVIQIDKLFCKKSAGAVFIIPYFSTSILECAFAGHRLIFYQDKSFSFNKMTAYGQEFLDTTGLFKLTVDNPCDCERMVNLAFNGDLDYIYMRFRWKLFSKMLFN